jgi:CRISPR-associated protein Cas5d
MGTNMIDFKPVSVKIWGDMACFTRPEMKVERVSYPVITPSAARAVLEAIFWKPEFEWQILRISVLKPIRYLSILRNEVKSVAVERTARAWEKNNGQGGYFADQDRTQRHSLILRDVEYLIDAEVMPYEKEAGNYAKFRDQFRRRVKRGQCLRQPYLGCREFSAYFAEPNDSDQPLDISMELGRMLFDLRYIRQGKKRGEATPVFFQPELKNGVMHIDSALYQKIAVPPFTRFHHRYNEELTDPE